MTMKLEIFGSASDLTDFVNTNAIPKADVQFVWCQDWKWYLMYWSA